MLCIICIFDFNMQILYHAFSRFQIKVVTGYSKFPIYKFSYGKFAMINLSAAIATLLQQ